LAHEAVVVDVVVATSWRVVDVAVDTSVDGVAVDGPAHAATRRRMITPDDRISWRLTTGSRFSFTLSVNPWIHSTNCSHLSFATTHSFAP
jgi:hypothetical protein